MNHRRMYLMIGMGLLVVPCTIAHGQSPAARLQLAPAEQSSRRMDRSLVVLRKLNKSVPSFDFDEEPFGNVLDWFRTQGLRNIFVNWRKLEDFGEIDRSTPVTLELTDMPLGELLSRVLKLVSAEASLPSGQLSYRIADGVIDISTRGDFSEEIVTRTYLVEDLLQSPHFYVDAPTISVAGRGGSGSRSPGAGPGASGSSPGSGIFEGGGEEQIDFQQLRGDHIEKLIRVIKTIKPDTWREGSGPGTIAEYRGILIISQTIKMHEIIGGTLRKMPPAQRERSAGRWFSGTASAASNEEAAESHNVSDQIPWRLRGSSRAPAACGGCRPIADLEITADQDRSAPQPRGSYAHRASATQQRRSNGRIR